MSRLAVIGCSKSKLEGMAKAQDLYQGSLFKKARRYCEKINLPYTILSAKYGLVDPQAHIFNYDTTIKDLTKNELTDLISCVTVSISRLKANEIVLLAGENYYKVIKKAAPEVIITRPMKGMGIGQQLKWLKEQLGA